MTASSISSTALTGTPIAGAGSTLTGSTPLPPGSRLDGVPEAVARDRRTLEVRQFYRLPRAPGEVREYDTRIWFYFPRGFGITSATWGHEAFYRDVNVYMRMHAPHLKLAELADLEHPTNPASVLRRALPALLDEEAPSSRTLDVLAKTLGAELGDAVTSAVLALKERAASLHGPDDIAQFERDVHQLCAEVTRALGAVRRLRAKARAYRTVAPATLIPSLAFAEEFASAVVDERFAELAARIDSAPALRDGTGSAVRLRLVLARTADEIVRRRVEQGFPTPSGEWPEYFTYRLGVLKKEMQRALYVNTRASTRDPFFRNSAAMVAAGLAATWATLAQIPLLTGGLTTSQGALFLGTAVGAYILKDRIKEWVRAALSKKLLRYDHDRHILGEALAPAGLGSFSGRAKERVRWVDNEEIPRDIHAIRTKHRTVRGVTPELENVLEYQRVVSFSSARDPVPEGFGVQEIFRLQLDEILKRLDEPVDRIAYFDDRAATFREAEMPKVYHLNLIAQCTNVATGVVTAARWRVVVNQAGVLHIDPVATRRRGGASDLTGENLVKR